MSRHRVIYVGMDVDKAKIACAAVTDERSEESRETVIANTRAAVQRYVVGLQGKGEEIVVCYEAGCCGFELYRQLTDLGVGCVVAAPGLIPSKPGDRIKTDRRDARKLARALRNGEVSGVYVPSLEDERVRDYLRLYEDVKGDLRKAKQRLLHFLLRHRIRYTEGTNWTQRHMRWLRELDLQSEIADLTLQEYLCQIDDLKEKRDRIERRIQSIAECDRYAEPVSRLKAFKGIETLIALSFVVEIVDFRRFARAEQFMAFLGLVPSERSSGGKRRVGGITKAGNSHLRKLLIEAAWQYRSYHPSSKRLVARRAELAPQLIAYANRAGRRLNKKYLRLIHAGKPSQVAVTATARELAGFVWGAMLENVA